GGEHLNRIVGQRRRQRLHLAKRHQLLHHLGHRDVEILGHVLDRRPRSDPDGVGLGQRRLRGRRTRLGLFVIHAAAPAPATLPARRLVRLCGGATGVAARSLRVDHHAPAAAGVAWRALALEGVAGGALVLGLAAGRSVFATRRSVVATGGAVVRGGGGGGRALSPR